jgi:hypothetical protein
MADLQKALAEIRSIRGQLARDTEFRGYGPSTLTATGAVAVIAAVLQARWLKDPAHHVPVFLWIWISAAAISVSAIGIETITRARRVHSGMAMEMVHSALEQFLPAIVAGLLLTIVLLRWAPQELWMLPGLWQLLFSMGVFASCRFLPRQVFGVGVWYLVSGFACLAWASGDRAFSPWAMGLPFGVGQLLVACVLQFGYRDSNEEQ